ncbi:putative reverse transcriptase domain-containing protein [Tanacetum coccineum]
MICQNLPSGRLSLDNRRYVLEMGPTCHVIADVAATLASRTHLLTWQSTVNFDHLTVDRINGSVYGLVQKVHHQIQTPIRSCYGKLLLLFVDHEQEAEAATVGTITRVPYSVRPFSGTVYVGIGPSRQVFALGPTARDVNTLHRQWSFEMQWHLHPFRHYRERPYVALSAPVAHVDHTDPNDPSPSPTYPAIEKLVSDWVAAALAQDHAARGNTNGAGGYGSNTGGNAQGQGGAPPAINGRGLLHGGTLKSPQLGHRGGYAKSWNDMKIMMREGIFYPPEEIQRMEVELWNLRVKDSNISAYTQRFNELVLLCPEMVPSEKKKAEGLTTTTKCDGQNQYWGLLLNVTVVVFVHFGSNATNITIMWKNGHKKKDCRSRNVASGTNARSAVVCYECGERGHKSNACTKRADQQGGDVRADKSFMDVRLSHLLDIKPAKLNTSYGVELADRKVVYTNTVLKGCTMNLLDHLFDIDIMPIELGTFDVIIGMDWLVERDAVIVCGRHLICTIRKEDEAALTEKCSLTYRPKSPT